MNVVIPAGGEISEEYARRIGTPFRALAPFGAARRPVLEIVLEALQGSGLADRIVVAAPDAVRERIGGEAQWLPDQGNGPANILAGLAAAPDADAPTLVCTSDLPLLTPAAICAFAQPPLSGDLRLGLVTQARLEAAYPDAPTSAYVRLTDAGPVTLGCLFVVRPAALLRRSDRLTAAFEARKSQWRSAALLGPGLLLRFLLGRLTLSAARRRAEQILRLSVEIDADTPPELAYDIDTPDDYAYAHTQWEKADALARP